MENSKQVKKFERIVVSCMLFFVAVVGVAIYSFIALGKTRRENARYDELIASLKQQEKILTENKENSSNPENLEWQVRYEFGMIEKDETLYKPK